VAPSVNPLLSATPLALLPIGTLRLGKEAIGVNTLVVWLNVPRSIVNSTLSGNDAGLPLHVLLSPMLSQKSLLTDNVAACTFALEAEIPNKTNKSMPENIAPEKFLEIYFVFNFLPLFIHHFWGKIHELLNLLFQTQQITIFRESQFIESSFC